MCVCRGSPEFIDTVWMQVPSTRFRPTKRERMMNKKCGLSDPRSLVGDKGLAECQTEIEQHTCPLPRLESGQLFSETMNLYQ